MSDSDVQKLCSSHRSSAWKPLVFTKPATARSWSATLIFARICTPIQSCRVAPPCTQASPTACKRRSLPWRQAAWRSRSSLRRSANTLSGSVAPSWPHCPPFSPCGSPSRSMTSRDRPSSTASASRLGACGSLSLYKQTGAMIKVIFVCFLWFSMFILW